jgi:hypothetical protein
MALLELLLFIALLLDERCWAVLLPGTQLAVLEAPLVLVLARVESVMALEPALPCASAVAGIRAMAVATNMGWSFMRISSFVKEEQRTAFAIVAVRA